MTASEIINQIKDLPVVPETACKLTRLLSEPDTHREELIQTLRCDNVMTAKLLRVCNSAHTGLSNSVGSIDQAVLLLGDNAIFRMVCAIGFGGAMGGMVFGLLAGYLLDHGFGYGLVFSLVGTFHVLAFCIVLVAIRSVEPIVFEGP